MASGSNTPLKDIETMKAFKKIMILALLCAVSFVFGIRDAGAVRVSLKRVIFEGSTRSEILTIINNTAETQTYRLGWRKYKMDEKESLQALEDEDDDGSILWADKMIRFAPRRVTIPAGSSQQVRLLLRRPSDLQNAEYRSHLWIVTETKPDKFNIQQDQGGQSIRLAVQPAISLPVFVRHGDLEASASIENAKLAQTPRGLNVSFTLNRQGSSSLYGDFEFTCNDAGNSAVLRQVRGISVYTEINKRYLDFDLPLAEGQSCKNVGIQYRADPSDPKSKGATLASASASL